SRLLWIELRGWPRNNGANNGKVFLTCRDAAKAIGTKSMSSIVRWYAENEHHGFLVKTAHGFLGSDGHGIGDHYRFTDLAHGTHPPTRDFEKWSGEPFNRGRRAQPKPTPPARSKRPKIGKPWEAEGISRRTWYRRKRGTVAPNPVPTIGTRR